ncbi:MAG: glycosyltransferase family 9 protein [Candidatus Latescibacteria bacterium]|nr:glycosyltransferase family 9 protein [Candidatus Latescibacterota bacterium]
MSSIAIIQTAFIGDVILATPLFEAAHISQPDDTVVAIVRKGCENIIENNPYVDEIVVWDKRGADSGMKGIQRIRNRLKALSVETVLIPHRSARTACTAFLSGAKKRIGFNKGGGAIFHTSKIPYRMGIHEVERNLMLAEAAGWKTDGLKPSIFPDDFDRRRIDSITGALGKYCVLAPGSVWKTKQWPVESFTEVGNLFAYKGMTIIVSGGKDDKRICEILTAGIPGAVNTCGVMSLRQSAELYRRSEFVLTGDTAPQHIAAAMGTWVFSLFGPTIRDFGFWPYSEKGIVIEENVECRPCGKHGHDNCPIKTHICMRNITCSKVIDIIGKKLEL